MSLCHIVLQQKQIIFGLSPFKLYEKSSPEHIRTRPKIIPTSKLYSCAKQLIFVCLVLSRNFSVLSFFSRANKFANEKKNFFHCQISVDSDSAQYQSRSESNADSSSEKCRELRVIRRRFYFSTTKASIAEIVLIASCSNKIRGSSWTSTNIRLIGILRTAQILRLVSRVNRWNWNYFSWR